MVDAAQPKPGGPAHRRLAGHGDAHRQGTEGLVELRLEVDPEASGPDTLVLRGRGVLDRRAFGIGRQAWTFGPRIQLDLAVRANRAAIRTRIETQEGEAA